MHLARGQTRALSFVRVRARARMSVRVCIHPVEISIEKVTPLHSARCYPLHILFIWVLVCQWDTRTTLRWRGIAIEVILENEICLLKECFTKCIFHLHEANYDTVAPQNCCTY